MSELQPRIERSRESVDTLIERIKFEMDSVALERDTEGNLLAPNGEVSRLPSEYHWRWVRTPTFKKWFGDWQTDAANASKVVDRNGEPLLVYHGSDEIFDARKRPPLRSLRSSRGYGSYFTPTVHGNFGATTHGRQQWACFLDIREIVPLPLEDAAHWHPDMYAFEKMKKESRKVLWKTLFNPQLKIGRGETQGDLGKKGEDWYAFSVQHPKQIMDVPSPLRKPSK